MGVELWLRVCRNDSGLSLTSLDLEFGCVRRPMVKGLVGLIEVATIIVIWSRIKMGAYT